MLVANSSAALYRRGMAKKPTKPKKRGDALKGHQLRAYLEPRVKGLGLTMERFTSELDLTKAAATGWFKTGSIKLETIFLIRDKFGFPAHEMLNAIGYQLGSGETSDTDGASLPAGLMDMFSKATDNTRAQVLRIARAAAEGRLTEADTRLLSQIADRFSKPG